MPARPPDIDREPVTYWEYERSRREVTNPGEDATSGSMPMPRLPSTSPWHKSIDEIVGVEPPINTTEDQ
jgi:hypothetical protein